MLQPLNSLSLAPHGLRSLIAASSSWQKWVKPGDMSASIAIESIHIGGLPFPQEIDGGANAVGYTPAQLAALRPFRLIGFEPRAGSNYEQVAMSAFLQSCRLLFSFEDAVDAGDIAHLRDAQTAFLNNAGGVLDDIQMLCGQNGLPNLQRLRIEKSITRADSTEVATRGDYHYMMFSAELGI